MKVKSIWILTILLLTWSCSSSESLKIYYTPLNYLVETEHPLTAGQEQELRDSALAQLPERVTIVNVNLVGETDGQTGMVLWMHPPDSPDEYIKANYFDREEWSWSIREN